MGINYFHYCLPLFFPFYTFLDSNNTVKYLLYHKQTAAQTQEEATSQDANQRVFAFRRILSCHKKTSVWCFCLTFSEVYTIQSSLGYKITDNKILLFFE